MRQTGQSQARPWLPSDTLASARVARPVTQAVNGWIERWAAGSGWQAGTGFTRTGDGGWSTLRQGECIDLTGPPKAMQDLAFAMLGVGARQDLTHADHKLLRRLAGAALDDLHQAIETACPAAASDGPRWRLTIGSAHGRSLGIECAEGVLATMARRSFTRTARPAALSPRRDALTAQRVACAAHLGLAALSVQQLAALEPGDVILLDRPVGDNVPLTVAGRLSDCRVALGGDPIITMQD